MDILLEAIIADLEKDDSNDLTARLLKHRFLLKNATDLFVEDGLAFVQTHLQNFVEPAVEADEAQVSELLDEIQARRDELDELEKRHTFLKEEIHKLRRELPPVGEYREKVKQLEQDIETAKTELTNKSNERTELEDMIRCGRDKRGELEKISQKSVRLKTEIQKLQDEEYLKNRVANVSDNLNLLHQQLTEELEELTLYQIDELDDQVCLLVLPEPASEISIN